MSRSPDHALSEIKLARLVGVSPTTWRAHKALGCPVPLRAQDLPRWQREYAAWRQANGKVASADRKLQVDPETQRWANERVKWTAIEKKIAVGMLARRLVERGEVERRTVAQIMAVRAALNDMVRKMASRLFNAPSQEELERELQAEVDHILESFARGLERVADDEQPEQQSGGDQDQAAAALD